MKPRAEIDGQTQSESSHHTHIERQLKKVDSLAKRLGVPKPGRQPVMLMKRGADEKERVLELIRGDWNDAQPWFVIDEEGRLMVLSNAESMMNIMQSLQKMGEEVFKSRMEKAIAKELPVDFHDVWTVAMHELRRRMKEGEQASPVDIDALIQNIKRRHPNLFYSLEELDIDEEDRKEAGF